MKICIKCGKEFETGSQITKIYCTERCQKKAHSERYRRGASYLAIAPARNKRAHTRLKSRVSELQQFVLEFKLSNPCPCGESDPVCLQFHHRDPSEKSFTISHMLHHKVSKEKLVTEISKCNLICANCHLKHHAKEKETNTGLAIPGRKVMPGSRRKTK